jgi:hypothetical protein
MVKGIVVDSNGDASTCLIDESFEVGDTGIFALEETGEIDAVEGMIVHLEDE